MGLPFRLLSQLLGQADTFQYFFGGRCFLLEKGMILEGGCRYRTMVTPQTVLW